jgi:hypothetical protein
VWRGRRWINTSPKVKENERNDKWRRRPASAMLIACRSRARRLKQGVSCCNVFTNCLTDLCLCRHPLRRSASTVSNLLFNFIGLLFVCYRKCGIKKKFEFGRGERNLPNRVRSSWLLIAIFSTTRNTLTNLRFQQMHIIYYMKYLQFLPTGFGLLDHHQSNFTKNTGVLSHITHMSPVYGVLLISVKSNVCVCVCTEIMMLK